MPNVEFTHTYTLRIPVDQYVHGDPKLAMLFLTQIVDIIAANFSPAPLVGACVDTGAETHVAFTFVRKADAAAFQRDWETVAKRVRDEQASHRFTVNPDDIPF